MEPATLETPCLLLHRPRLERNAERMGARMRDLGVALRPHLKTAKCLEAARLVHGGHSGPVTVSTLNEAEFFFAGGFTDILYAVGIAPQRLDRAAALTAAGCRLGLITDHPDMAAAMADYRHEVPFEVLIEIDCDGERAGLAPDDPRLVSIARRLAAGTGSRFAGFMTHGGGSYRCRTPQQIAAHAERERQAVVRAAQTARSAGIEVSVVSAGSTPTATFARDLTGVTEMRPGVYLFQDLYQAGLGVCRVEDIALSVLTTVIGHQPSANRLLVDAGSLALSRDRSTADQAIDCGYGLVCDAQSGRLLDGLLVQATNQEHGMIGRRDGRPLDYSRFAPGTRLRILPNHACMTAAAHDRYFVEDDEGRVIDCWLRCNGW